jgi:hypothetical protein
MDPFLLGRVVFVHFPCKQFATLISLAIQYSQCILAITRPAVEALQSRPKYCHRHSTRAHGLLPDGQMRQQKKVAVQYGLSHHLTLRLRTCSICGSFLLRYY